MIYIALIARITRASVLDVLGEDYIRTAYAKGLTNRVVLMRHALRNAAVPIVTVIGIGVALLIGGVVVTESVYNIPGLGRLTVDAVLGRDYPTIQAVILLFSFAYVLINLLIDLSYTPARPEDPLLSAARSETLVIGRGRGARARASGASCCVTPGVAFGGVVLLLMLLIALRAPMLGTLDPAAIDPTHRNLTPGRARTPSSCRAAARSPGLHWMGTDSLGRDVYSRVDLRRARVADRRRHGRGAQHRRRAS